MRPFSRVGHIAALFTAAGRLPAMLAAMVLVLLGASAPIAAAAPPAAAPTQPITLSFDHLSTGFELDGVHRDLPCESCHLNAVFKGTPRDCGTCHITGSVYNATPKNQTHIQSTNACAACHNTISFRPDVHFDHANVLGSCVSCHNNVIAQGEGPTHPQTSEQCQACHTVLSWNPPKVVDHTQIPLSVAGFCIVCHNGVSATGKNKGHIQTTLECGDCHLTTNWMGAAFDHTGIKTGCYSCHNGVKAVGKQGSHMPTTNVCEDCHTTGLGTATPSWVPSGFDHRQMTVQTCATCHNGTVKISTGFVSGSPSNHVPLVPTAPDCGFCHGNNPAAETWTVLATSIAGLHTGVNTSNCLVCHASQTFAGVPAPYTPMQVSGISPTKKTPLAPPHIPLPPQTDCSVCHGPAYNAGGFGPATAMNVTTHKAVSTTCDTCHDTGKAFYTGSGTPLQTRPADHINSTDPAMATGDCSQCHETADWVSKVLPAGHMPNPANLTCVQCHASAPSDYTPATLAANSALHSGITGDCGQCHGSTATALTWFNNFTPKDAILAPSHIPYLSGTDCSSCHTSSTYAVGTFGPMNMTQAKHAFVPTSCDTCHEAGLSFYMGAATPALQGRPPDHTSGNMVAPNDCSQCHTTANWNSNVFPAGHMPNPSNLACNTCHTSAPTDYTAATLAANSVLHTGIAGNCGQCHGATTALTWYNNYTPKDAVLTPGHIPYAVGTDCSSCHSSATYAVGTFGPMNMTQTTHAFVATTCDTCHEAGLSFYMGAASPALQGRPTDHTGALAAPNDCSKCHTTANWNSTVLPTGHMPNPAGTACNTCHTSAPTDYTPATLAALPIIHTGITIACDACHGNTTTALTWANNYTPKDAILNPAHIPYTAGTDCSSCHAATYATGGFGPTNMSAAKHAFVPTTCDTCHDTGANFYLGASTPALQIRPADHISSGDAQQQTGDCSICHNTTNWLSSTLPIGHMPNPAAQACSVCHVAINGTFASYATLGTVAQLHTGITGNCGQCHGSPAGALTFYNNNDNPKAAVLTPAHIPYLSGTDCSSCHTANYVTGGFGPTNMSAAKHAFVPTTCDDCHDTGANFYLGASTPALQTRPADHISNGNAQQQTGDCSICHNTTNWLSQTLPIGHMPNPAAQACSVCHVAIDGTFASYATMGTVAQLHTGITGGCAQCHGTPAGALTFYNNNDNPKAAVLTPSHIPYLSGTDCSSCHASNYVTGGFGPTNMSAAKHAFVPTSCDDCHEAGLSFYMGASTPALQGRPADHTAAGGAEATSDCSSCHNTTNWNSQNFPAGHMPNPGNQACATCHTAIDGSTLASYATLASIPVLHTGITNNCGQCHGSPTAGQLTFYNNNDNPKAAVLTPAHIPYSNGVDCINCHTVNYASGGFGPMNMTAATHVFVPTTCDTCHELGKTWYLGNSTNPLQTRPNSGTYNHFNSTDPNQATADCSQCHVTSTWVATALPSGHMPNPGGQACTVCHTQAPTSYTTGFATLPVLHTGITTGCAQCHGQTQLSFVAPNADPPKPATLTPPHIPAFTGEDCSACHTPNYATGGFGPMNMTQATHAGVGSTCNGCHEAGLSFYMGAANPGLQGRPADHTAGNQVSPNDCSLCHTTANWISNVAPTGHMPNPGNQACNVCHTAAPTNYATLASNAVLHTGIAGNCGACHGTQASGVISFYNNNDPPKSAQLAPNHIPYISGTDCSSCHTTTSYAAGTFGPMNMTQATHAFASTSCDTCHEAGLSFYMGAANPGLQGRPADHTAANQVSPNDCSICHTTANWVSSVTPTGHMPNPGNQACGVCHTSAPTSYVALASNAVLHTGIAGNCGQCHGTQATGVLSFYNNNDNPKSAQLTPAHIPYLAGSDCSSCHTTTSYAAGTFGPMNMTQATHAFAPTTCDTCHEAGLSFYMGAASPALQGRPADHTGSLAAPNDCSQCHTTANWNSTVLPTGHMPNPSNLACTTCHVSAPTDYTTATLAANSVLHTGIAGNCGQCHGSTTGALTWYQNFTPKDAVLTPVHIPYTAGTDCSNCHSSSTYAVGTFGPMNMNQAKHSFVPTTCNTCHEAGLSFYMGAASPALQGRPADHTSGNMVAPNDCSQCHTTANWNSTTLPSGHMPNPANQACTVCHVSAPSDYTTATLAANSVLHTGISGNCGTCHGGTSALTWYNNYTPKDGVLSPAHIPYTSGTDCSSCHKSTTYAVGTFGPMNMSQATHAFVTTTCDTCHEAGLSFYMGSASPALQGRPADHTAAGGGSAAQQTGDCSGCHTTANWNSNTLPTGHMPNPANQGCQVCHTAIGSTTASYATLAAISVLHTGITNNCSQCHGLTQLTFYNNNDNPKSAVLTPAHIPYLSGTDCGSCHTANYVSGGFAPMNMSQASHAFVSTTCTTCHQSGGFYVGSTTAIQLRPTDATHSSGTGLTGDCSGCHTTANWNSTALPSNHMPNPANQACTVCHTNSSDYSVVAANSVLHTGITSSCITCHAAPNATAPVYATNFTPKDAILSPPHIPTSTTPCEDCHTATNFTAFSGTTMTAAKHTSMFTVISASNCDVCHGVSSTSAFYPGSSLNLQIRPTDSRHSSGSGLTDDCSHCHSTSHWDDAQKRPATTTKGTVSLVVKTGVTARPTTLAPVTGGAAAARVGVAGSIAAQAAASQAASAQVAAAATSGAPGTAAAAGATTALGTGIAADALKAQSAAVSHIGITNNCASCHNGVLATGKGPAHVASNTLCENCHTTLAWLPARFDHQGVTAACESCHNGVTAVGKPTQHVKASADCGACHGTIAWLPATFDHTGVTAACQSCHNGVIAIGKQVGHAVTTKDCGSCHNTLTWTIPTSTPAPLKPLLRKPAVATPTRGAASGSIP